MSTTKVLKAEILLKQIELKRNELVLEDHAKTGNYDPSENSIFLLSEKINKTANKIEEAIEKLEEAYNIINS